MRGNEEYAVTPPDLAGLVDIDPGICSRGLGYVQVMAPLCQCHLAFQDKRRCSRRASGNDGDGRERMKIVSGGYGEMNQYSSFI